MQTHSTKKVGQPRKHSSNSAKTAASNKKWIDAGNKLANAWIPNTSEAKEALKAWAQQQRLNAGTMLPQDLVW